MSGDETDQVPRDESGESEAEPTASDAEAEGAESEGAESTADVDETAETDEADEVDEQGDDADEVDEAADDADGDDDTGAEVESDTDDSDTDDSDGDTDVDSEDDDIDAEVDADADDADSEEDPAAAAGGGQAETGGARAQRRGAHARRVTPRERLRELVAPQANRTQAIIALACLVVGFGLSVQVRSSSQEASFTSLRQSELVSLLDRLNQRQEDLREELLRLEQEKAALGSEDSEAARKAAQDRQHTLAILAGTEPATGPGIDLFVRDPKGGVDAGELLNAVQELRDAGAEVLQIGNVRIAVDSYFLDAKSGVIIDGKKVEAPYRIRAIGDPHTMATAMDIPGGVLETLHRAGAEATVSEGQSLTVSAVRDP